MPVHDALDISGLTVCYGDTVAVAVAVAVADLSLAIPAGQAVALLGPNGAGKSTTVNAVLGLLRPLGRRGPRARAESCGGGAGRLRRRDAAARRTAQRGPGRRGSGCCSRSPLPEPPPLLCSTSRSRPWTSRRAGLSQREADVLRAGADGATVAPIAGRLFLSEGTVRNYLSSATGTTGARTRVQAARIAEEKGWL